MEVEVEGETSAASRPAGSAADSRSPNLDVQTTDGHGSQVFPRAPLSDSAHKIDEVAVDISMAISRTKEEGRDDRVSMAHVSSLWDGDASVSRDDQVKGHKTRTKKRKSASRSQNEQHHHYDTDPASSTKGYKRVKLGDGAQEKQSWVHGDWSSLPPEIWHHIFAFCSPKALGNLLQVNRQFNSYLCSPSAQTWPATVSSKSGVLDVSKPAAIWQASRRLHFPGMPAPLRSKTELEMWRLVTATKCQSCGKMGDGKIPHAVDDPLRLGPGLTGVAIAWPFASALCGRCLLEKGKKEIDLLFSSSIPSSVIPALPFVYLTHEFHLVAAGLVERDQLPADLKVTKLFLSADVDEIETELASVKDMGPGAIEEWLKGLPSRRSQLLNEASKWEKWEKANALSQIGRSHSQGGQPSSLPRSPRNISAKPEPGSPNVQDGTAQLAPSLLRPPRTQEEAAALKSVRKNEIERRCRSLNPPLPLSVLRHMPAFQAAIQIITPLDDAGWEVLKPRLLAQRAEAEMREGEQGAQPSTGEPAGDHRRLEATLATTKEARDLIDKQWEIVQAPLRARIVELADQFVRESWDGGAKVTRDSCAKFAAQSLIYIRKQFYDGVATAMEDARAAGEDSPPDPPQGPFTQKLTLENMKWIFDSKIKPYTEKHKRELFFCSTCQHNPRAYGFEGVIQHYAAKHTSALSLGSIVVHWRAEWPEEPPFDPEGRSHRLPDPMKQIRAPQALPDGYNGHPALPASAPPAVLPSGVSYTPPLSSYGGPNYGDRYHQPPAPAHAPSQYQPPSPYSHPDGYGFPSYPPQPGPYQPYQNPAAVPVGHYSSSAGPDASQPHQPPPPGSMPYGYSYGAHVNNNASSYHMQLHFLAKASREVFHALGGIKNLPGSARVQATIHTVAKKYRARFSEAPPLTMFMDGLSNLKDMRPVRMVNELACKSCELGLGNGASAEKGARSTSLPKLVKHFQAQHIELMQQMTPHLPPLDWANDMVFVKVKDHHFLSGLRTSLASNTQKYHLLAETFPEAFKIEAPVQSKPALVPAPALQPVLLQSQLSSLETATPLSIDNHAKFYSEPRANSGQASHSTGSGGQDSPFHQQLPSQRQHHNPVNQEATAPGSTHELTRQPSQQQHQKGSAPKAKSTKKARAAEAARAKKDQEDKKAEADAQREEDEIRAMWATDRAVAARAAASSAKVDTEVATHRGSPKIESQSTTIRTGTPHQHRIETSQKSMPRQIPLREEEEEPNLLAAWETHLNRSNAPPAGPNDEPHQRQDFYRGISRPSPPVSSRPPLSPSHNNSQYPTAPMHDKRPYRDSWQQEPSGNLDQNKLPLLIPARDYYDQHDDPPREMRDQQPRSERPARTHVEHQGTVSHPDELRYEGFRQRDAPPPRRAEMDYNYRPSSGDMAYDRERRRPDDTGQAHAPPDYYHRRDGPYPARRAVVQEYEIVQVIDDQGQYYIRRPVIRREPEPYYGYEEHTVIRPPVESYPRYEPVYHREPPRPEPYNAPSAPSASGSGPQRPHLRRQISSASVSKADPAYYEPYDPHNPTAAVVAYNGYDRDVRDGSHSPPFFTNY